MSDYIKRKDAINAVVKALDKGMYKFPTYFLGTVPSADVAPVRHGRWIEQGLSPYEGTRRCSICESFYDIKEQFNYCPNCGAKMDEEKDDD
jgi:hypothetical protein